jgi:hypothetical protein
MSFEAINTSVQEQLNNSVESPLIEQSAESTTYSLREVERTPYQILRDYIDVDIEQVPYQIVLSFGAGLFFSVWSTGIFLLVLFLISFELFYGLIIRNFSVKYFIIRIAIIGAYLLGWLLGRIVIGDNAPIRLFYNDYFQEMGRPGHCHPGLRSRRQYNSPSARIAMNDDLIDQYNLRYVKNPVEPQVNQYRTSKSMFSIFPEPEVVPEPRIPIASASNVDSILSDIMCNVHQ